MKNDALFAKISTVDRSLPKLTLMNANLMDAFCNLATCLNANVCFDKDQDRHEEQREEAEGGQEGHQRGGGC